MAKPDLKVFPEDVVDVSKRGFARLNKEKLRLISKAASAIGSVKGGAAKEVTAARLKRNHLLDWLAKPFNIQETELKMTDAAAAIGVSRQCLRRILHRHDITTRRKDTAFMVSNYSLRVLHKKLSGEYKDHLASHVVEIPTEDLIQLEEAAKILKLPIWQALPLLNLHAKKSVLGEKAMYNKLSVEQCAFDHMADISMLRITGKYR
jgi:hypothetical protein